MPKIGIDIPDGAYVEGSRGHGGIQPDYLIDSQAPELRPLWNYAASLRLDLSLSKWEKASLLVARVRELLPHRDYRHPLYLKLLAEHSSPTGVLPLSKYVAQSVGVCREHSILLHLALKRAGISNWRVYARVEEDSLTEDHGFVVVSDSGERWILDSYSPSFNGLSLDELMAPSGLVRQVKRLDLAQKSHSQRKILELHTFPKIWKPF